MAGAGAAPARRPSRARKPVWQEVEEQEARKVGNRVRAARPKRVRRRYAVVHDTNGPKVRLGVAWFLVALVGVTIGPLPAAVVYGGGAALAAAQTARCWRKRRQRPNEAVAAAMAAGMGLGACLGAGGAGFAVLAGVAFAIGAATGDTKSPHPTIADVGSTLQCALPPGIVAMSMVLLTRLDQGSALGLLLLVSAYETGDFLVGSGARNPYEGPAAGGSAIVVVTFILSTLPISALDFGQAWLFGGLVLLLAPLGQVLASALLPSVTSPATALRRLDSLLLAAPVWCFGVGLIVA